MWRAQRLFITNRPVVTYSGGGVRRLMRTGAVRKSVTTTRTSSLTFVLGSSAAAALGFGVYYDRDVSCEKSSWDVPPPPSSPDHRMYQRGRIDLREVKRVRSRDMTTAMKLAGEKTVLYSIGITGLILLGHNRSKAFQKFITPSGKVGLLVMSAMGIFVLETQLNLTRLSRARKWDKNESIVSKENAIVQENRSLFDTCVDLFAEKHFYLLGGSFAVAAGILGYNFSKHTHLKISQRVMHTRVAFQGTAIGVLLTIALLNYGARQIQERRKDAPTGEDA